MVNFRDVAAQAAQMEASGRAGEFAHLAALLALGQGSVEGALRHAEGMSHPLPRGVDTVLKTAVDVGDISAAVGFSALANAFVATLAEQSAFDAMFSAMVRAVPGSPIFVVSTTAVGTTTSEAAPKPLSRIELSADALPHQKVVATVVLTRDQLRFALPGAMSLISAELRRAVTHATDEVLISALPFPTPAISSTTPLADLAAALDALETGTASRLFILAGTDAAKELTVAAGTDTTRHFPEMGPLGGTIAGIPTFVTAGLEADSWALVDAAPLVAWRDTLRLSTAEHAAIQLSDDPGEDGVGLTSLWQKGLVAVRAERWIAVTAAREGAAVLVEDVSYGGGE